MEKPIFVNDISLNVYHAETDHNRPTIIFLHDSLGCIQLWRDFPARLAAAAHCNLLIYDRQGYGKSAPFADEERTNEYLQAEADVLHALMQRCNVQRAILFGHSDGGSIALIAAAKYPQFIMGVITEGAHIFVEELTLHGIREAVTAYQTTDLKQKLERYHDDKTDAVFHAWADTWLRPSFRTWSIAHFLPQIKCPVLAIQGASDEYGTEAQVDGIVNSVSGEAGKLMIPSIGHSPHKEATAIVSEASAAFICQLR